MLLLVTTKTIEKLLCKRDINERLKETQKREISLWTNNEFIFILRKQILFSYLKDSTDLIKISSNVSSVSRRRWELFHRFLISSRTLLPRTPGFPATINMPKEKCLHARLFTNSSVASLAFRTRPPENYHRMLIRALYLNRNEQGMRHWWSRLQKTRNRGSIPGQITSCVNGNERRGKGRCSILEVYSCGGIAFKVAGKHVRRGKFFKVSNLCVNRYGGGKNTSVLVLLLLLVLLLVVVHKQLIIRKFYSRRTLPVKTSHMRNELSTSPDVIWWPLQVDNYHLVNASHTYWNDNGV